MGDHGELLNLTKTIKIFRKIKQGDIILKDYREAESEHPQHK